MKFNPCPFCGNTELELTPKNFYDELLEEHGRACISVSCHKCKTDMYEHTDDVTYEDKVELLIEKWNRRVN